MADLYFIAAGESLHIITEWRAGRKAAMDAFHAIAKEHGCKPVVTVGWGAIHMDAMIPDDTTVPPPPGWRVATMKLLIDKCLVPRTVFKPAKSTKLGRKVAGKMKAAEAPGKGVLQQLCPGMSHRLESTFAHPGLVQLPDGREIIVCSEGWGAPLDAVQIKSSEYYALRGD